MSDPIRYEGADGEIHVVLCAACNGEVRVVRRDSESTEYSCPCGRATILHIDKGQLDLGIMRDSVLNDVFDYELWSD